MLLLMGSGLPTNPDSDTAVPCLCPQAEFSLSNCAHVAQTPTDPSPEVHCPHLSFPYIFSTETRYT